MESGMYVVSLLFFSRDNRSRDGENEPNFVGALSYNLQAQEQ